MPRSKREIEALLYKIDVLVQQIAETIDERAKLRELGLVPSANENEELSNMIHKTVQSLETAQVEVEQQRDENLQSHLRSLSNNYTDVHAALTDSGIDAPEFKYETRPPPRAAPPKAVPPKAAPSKAVRFKDVPDESDTSEMMGTQPFQPYRDDPEDSLQEEVDSRSNHQMFAEHQQTMMRQDQDLDYLHRSISRQHRMGKDIDQELDEQLIILNDLEQGVDNSSHRIQRATTRLNNFRRMARENGSLTTIIILTVILILLLVVLN
ncbi:hypothetical protein KGF57_005265 [Candida theae]|uniref:t-SNARE coiled-coil homology domain-containing protein n=1 Tax=Candida theae TaxID=1198502 RepID=A0AAD5FWA0_9ASCO|nr:uncharacterized protein KGF57_005265 [Candida theae]KAI5948867.1 hypothetical protein KGF57_005265 [Candida theae]